MTKIFTGRLNVLLFAVISTALWGSLYSFIKLGLKAFEIVSGDVPGIILFAGSRFIISGIIMVAFISIRDKRVNLPDRTNIGVVLKIGIISIVIHYIFTYVGLSMIEGSKSAILKQIGLLFIICFAYRFCDGDRFTVSKLIGGILGLASIIVINMNGLSFSFNLGDALIILASVCSVITSIVSKNAYKIHSPVYVIAYSQLIGGILLSVIGILFGGRLAVIDYHSVSILLYMCLASTIAYVLWNMLVKYNDISKLSVIKFLEPLFGVIFSGILLGENIFKITYVLSFAMVCTGIMIGTRRE